MPLPAFTSRPSTDPPPTLPATSSAQGAFLLLANCVSPRKSPGSTASPQHCRPGQEAVIQDAPPAQRLHSSGSTGGGREPGLIFNSL